MNHRPRTRDRLPRLTIEHLVILIKMVTPTAKLTKGHFVIVDAVSVTKSLKTDSQPLERKPGMPLKDLLGDAGCLIRLRPLDEKINSKFLPYVLRSSNLRNQIESKAKSTSGVNNINSEELKSLIIPLCALEEQQRIVEEIESRLSVCDKLEEAISQSLAQSENLMQSILKQAFERKLVKAH